MSAWTRTEIGTWRTNGIMQTEGIIAESPLITDTRGLLNDKMRHAQVLQPRAKHKSRLTSSNNKDLWVGICKLQLGLAVTEPLAVSRLKTPARTFQLGIILEVIHESRHQECLPLSARRGHQSNDARSDGHVGLEREANEDPDEVCALGRELRVDELDVGHLGESEAVFEELLDAVLSLEGAHVPGEGEGIAPPGVGMEEGEDARDILRLDGTGERGDERLCGLLNVEVVGDRGLELVESWQGLGTDRFNGGHDVQRASARKCGQERVQKSTTSATRVVFHLWGTLYEDRTTLGCWVS